MKNLTQKIIIASIAVLMTACGQQMTSKGAASQGVTGNGVDQPNYGDPSIDYKLIQQQALSEAAEAEAAAESAIQEAEGALNKISLSNGSLSFGSGDLDQQLIVDRIVKKILDKVLEKLEIIPGKFDNIRAKLADAMSKLDASNPLHQRAIDALMVAMERVDQVEDKYNSLLDRVADLVDKVASRLDGLAALVPFPANLAVAWELSAVKDVLYKFQDQLRNR